MSPVPRGSRPLAVAMGALAVVGACDGDHGGTRESRRTNTSATGSGSAAVTLVKCAPEDVTISVAGEGAGAMTAVYVEVALRGTRPCRMDAPVDITITEPDGTTLHAAGNPGPGRLVGDIRPGSNASFGFVWAGCAGIDQRHRVAVTADVDGFGLFRGEGITPRCGD